MKCGRAYMWIRDPATKLGGRVAVAVVPLVELVDRGAGGSSLCGRFVRVRNAGAINELNQVTSEVSAVPIGDARPNEDGDFIFEPGIGGGRIDKVELAEPDFRQRYIQASRFGEVNTYYHLTCIARYVDTLLRELNARPLPRVTAVVNAHHAATEVNRVRDGVERRGRWLPFQGAHYRLPGAHYGMREHDPISPDGEIHLGPGRTLLSDGALFIMRGRPYRANASHNAGILYHEYGHHVTRHTADFLANADRPVDRQNNRKLAIDEGTCDYWAAAMLGTPHVWAWHHRHDEYAIHRRSLLSAKTMADFDGCPDADPHANGTIWGAALWDLRTHMEATEPDGAHLADRLLVQALLLLAQRRADASAGGARQIQRARASFASGLNALLEADAMLYGGRYHAAVSTLFSTRGIYLDIDVSVKPIGKRLGMVRETRPRDTRPRT